MIEITNISKKYGDHVVLNDISLRFPKGKITSLIGSNGSLSNNLLRII